MARNKFGKGTSGSKSGSKTEAVLALASGAMVLALDEGKNVIGQTSAAVPPAAPPKAPLAQGSSVSLEVEDLPSAPLASSATPPSRSTHSAREFTSEDTGPVMTASVEASAPKVGSSTLVESSSRVSAPAPAMAEDSFEAAPGSFIPGPISSGRGGSGSTARTANSNTLLSEQDVALAAPQADAVPPVIQTLRLQAEATTGVTRGSVSGGTTTTTPVVVSLANASTSDRPNADAADGDAYVDFGGLNGNFNAGSGEYLQWTFAVPAAGTYDLAFGYAFSSASASNRPMRLEVNGQIWDRLFDFQTTGNNAVYSEAVTRVHLEAGTQTVRLTATGFSGPNLDYLEIRSADPHRIVIQAEDLLSSATTDMASLAVNRPITLPFLNGKTQPETFRVGAEGDAYLDWGSAANTLDIPVTATVAGTYSITITYANGGTTGRPLALTYQDGTAIGTFALAPTTAPAAYPAFYEDLTGAVRPADGNDVGTVPDQTGWEGWTKSTLTVNVTLNAGTTVLRLSGAGGPNIDKFEFVLVEAFKPEPVAPSDITLANLSVAENLTGAVIGRVTVTDADSAAHTIQVFEGATLSTRFEVVNGELKLRADQSLDFEAGSSLPIRLVATDAGGLSVNRSFAIAITNDTTDDVLPPQPNTTPTAGNGSTQTNEDTAVTFDVAPLIADADADAGDVLTVTATVPAAQGTVSVNGTLITFTPAANFSGQADIAYVVTDNGSPVRSATASLTVAVTPVDDAATALSVTPVSVAENVAGAVVATIAITDIDTIYGPDDVMLSGADAAKFRVIDSGGALHLALREGVSLDFEGARPEVSVTVGGLSQSVTLSVTNDMTDDVPGTQPNTAPTALNGTAQTSEDTAVTIDVASLIADVDTGGTLSVTATVPAAQGTVSVNGTVITFTPAANFSGQASIAYIVTDNGSPALSASASVTVAIAPVDDAATGLSVTALPVAENAPGAIVANIAITDIDSSYLPEDVVLSGADAGRFEVVGTAGALQLALRQGQTLNFEGARPEVSVSVGDLTQSVTLAVTNLNEAPMLTGTLAAASVPASGGSVSLAGLVAADPDGTTPALGLRLAGGGDLPSGISLSGGAVTVAAGVAPGAYAFEVFATDGQLTSAAVPFTLTIQAPPMPEPFNQILIQAEAGRLTIVDTDINTNDTFVRNPWNKETSNAAGLVDGLRPGFTGSGYLDFGDTPGDTASYSFTVAEAGSYDIHVRYASAGNRPLAFRLDGAALPNLSNLPFLSTDPDGTGAADGFNNWSVQKVTVTLTAGTHTIAFAIPGGATSGPNLDAIAVTRQGATATFNAPNALPVVTEAGFTVAEGTVTVGTVTASDLDGDRVDFALTANAATDNALFVIDTRTGALSFKTAPDFEGARGAGPYTVEVEAFDGTGRTLKTLAVAVTNVNEAPVITTTVLSATENQTAVGLVAATDVDGNALTYALTANAVTDNALFAIDARTGALSFLTAPDYEALPAGKTFNVEVAVSDGSLTTSKTITVSVTDVAEGGPVPVVFGAITPYSSQDRPQDGGTVTATPDSLTLDGNFWKRVSIGSYTVTEATKLEFDLRVGTGGELPEIVAIGFDVDEDPFDADASIYQLGGSQTQGGFIDLRGSGTPNGDGTVRFVIDLGAHAGKTLTSLVVVNDDDSRPNLGSSTYTNVRFVETADANAAPVVVGGGIADRTIPETGSLEIDLPFLDPDGDALSYTLEVKNAAGAVVPNGGLTITDGVLSGSLAALGNGVFTVTVRASDGTAFAEDSFSLTVTHVNKAPVAEDVALEPYFGRVGTAFTGFDINGLSSFFSDPESEALTFTIEDLPPGLSVNAEGYVSGTPIASGTFAVKVRASDPAGLSDTLTLTFVVEASAAGNVVSVEAEALTGLSTADGFFATGATAASGSRLILLNQGDAGSVSTNLAANGLADGYYRVTAYVFDETDGASTFSLSVDGTQLRIGGTSSVVLNDAGPGSFVNPLALRGTAANAGNLKAITFDTIVRVEAGSVMTLNGQAIGGESLRFDRFTFERVEAPNAAPTGITLTGAVAENAVGALVGLLAATDAEGDAVSFTVSDPRFVVVRNTETGQTELRLAAGAALNHETDNGTTISVVATDARGAATTAQVTLSVTDVNEAPTLSGTIAAQVFQSDAGGEVNLAVLTAADPDAGDAATLFVRLAGGGALPTGIVLDGSVLRVAPNVAPGAYAIEVLASDGELASAPVAFTVTVEQPGTPQPFEPIVIQGEAASVTLTQAADANSTLLRTTTANPETPGGTKVLDQFGLRAGYTGTGYLDFGNDAGDRASFVVTVAQAGTYELAIRYASGDARALDLAVGTGPATLVEFANTGAPASGTTPAVDGFNVWATKTVTVTLAAGANTLSLAIPAGRVNGPNIDSLTISKPQAPADVSADADDIPLFLSGPIGELTGAAKESINFKIAGVDADIVKTEISFDNGVTRTLVRPDADGDFVADGSGLAAGSYTARVYVTDGAGNVASSSMSIVIGGTVTVAPFTIQAEDATRVTVQDTGVPTNADFTRVVDAAHPDATGNYRVGAVGGAYMDFGANAGDAITVNVDAPAAGTYLVTFRYANGGAANRPLDLRLNGGTALSVDFVPGPVIGTGTTASGWESWVEKTVELTLKAGANTIALAIPAGALAGPNIDEIRFVHQGSGPSQPQPFQLTIEAETFTPIDTTGTGNAITQARTLANKEPTLPLLRDVNGDGLWDGFTGTGYLDMGAQIGDAASFNLTTPQAGTYTFAFRYSNGGNPQGDRPMTVTVNGVTKTLSFPGTDVNGWDNWKTATVEIDLAAGANTVTIANTVANGPNIDSVTISRDGAPVDPRGRELFQEVVKINFEPAPGQTTQGLPAGYVTPAGYLADTGAAYGDRGNGFSYGWVTEASVVDGTANGTIAAAQPANAHWYKNTVTGASNLQKTYAHFEFPGAGAAGARAWEMALANGTYQVKLSIGDTAGAFDSTYAINVEGKRFMPSWVPANPLDNSQNGGGFRSTLVTGIVQVTDGRLTVDSIGGTNTEIQYLEIDRLPDLTPTDTRTADLDYSTFAAPRAAYLNDQVSIALGENGQLPTGINPLSSFVVGVNVQAPNHRGPNIAHVEGIKLVETLTGQEVAINVQISGGADSLTIRPLQALKANTSYTLKVEDVLDLGSITDAAAAIRQMQDLTTTFVTGVAPTEVAREVAFTTSTLLNGFVDGAGGFTSIEFGPDGKLYVATIMGEIFRWSVNSDGSINKASKESLVLDYLQSGADRRGIIGLTFDPTDPNTIWISDNYPIPRENKAFDTPEFSGRVSKITLGQNGSFTGATAETYLTGLPRSGGDHVTNSLEFRANPDAGQAGEPAYLLYLSQGSNSAAGAPDGAWGNRPERLLNAAVLEIDPTRKAPTGGFDVRTEPVTVPTTQNPLSSFNSDGTYPGFYNPYAADAVLKIFATGIRNAYDLVWHSNGHLYMPTNGTASGGKTFDDPTQPGSQIIVNSPTQDDYFFTVEQGKYYGHPNILRDEYILNGGNPTSGVDKNEVTDRKDGNPNTDGYDAGVRPDLNYDLDGAYSLGRNQSPNGAIEYKGSAFGTNLKGAVLFAQFSTGDNVRAIRVDASGKIIGDDVLRRPDGSVINNYIDPLDIIENPVTGQLYLMTLNRGTGASQLILLTPAPGGVTQDLTADEGGNLALVAVNVSNPAAAVFQLNGLDSDITAVRVSFNGGPSQTVTLDPQNRFTANVGTLTGPVIATVEVTDDALNRASTTASFTPGQNPGPTGLVSLMTIQAEDTTPGDGTAVTVATGSAAQIQIRSAANPEPNATGTGYVNGLRPGAVGLDGNTSNTDGVPGGYADFGASNADFVTFSFSVPSTQAGAGVIKVRYANGATADRPLEAVLNGVSLGNVSFVPPTGVTGDPAWTVWQTVDVPANLVAGLNTITFKSVAATGPNIDQIEVLVPEAQVPSTPYTFYEAETAQIVGAKVVTENRNQVGTGFVDFDGTGDQSITWTVNAASAGSFEIGFRYALAASKADRPLSLTVNGVNLGPVNFEGFGPDAENTWQFETAIVNLRQGANTVTVTAPNAVGPNIDQLRVATGTAAPPFEPDYVSVTTESRIELEQTADSSTRILNSQAVEFYFKVAANGLYALDLAANAGAANGGTLRLFLNGTATEEIAFPGVGTAGERTVYVNLEAGTSYALRVLSSAPGANALDYLDVRRAPGNPNADIAVQSLDPAYLDNRLHFSYLEDPDSVAPDAADRDFKDSGTVRITNTGTETLSLTDYDLTGPFVLANPTQLDGLTIAAGQSADVTVLFNRAAYTPPTSNIDATSTVFTGALKLITNDADTPVTTIDLAGFWQARDEGGQEPNVNEIWKIFGFGNVIEGLTLRGGGENSVLSTNDVFAKTDETEVLSPYWRIADGVTQAKVTQIAAFHGTGGATLHIHNPGDKGANVRFWDHEGTDNQRLLPNAGNDTTFATRTFDRVAIPDAWAGNDIFGISVAGLSTDPRLNPRGNVEVPGAQQGHTVKMFQALDAQGKVIPNVYLGVMDYTGINYDYNDNLFVIEGVTPVGFGQHMVVSGLDDAAAGDRLVFTNIDSPANASQAFRNEATFTIRNDGSAALTIDSVTTGSAAFQIVGTPPASIAANASATVTVRFVGTHNGTSAGADLTESTLTIRSNDFVQGEKVIALAGLAQEFSENNSEPTVAQIVKALGYSTDMAQGDLANGGRVETVGNEVLMPYLERLDATKAVEVIQVAAFLNQGNVARLGFHGLASSQVTNLFANDDQQGQTVLPDQLVTGTGAGASVARGTINQSTPFGLYISVDGRPTYSSWTDPVANRIDPQFGQLVGDDQGHLIRFFEARDANGAVIAGTYIGIQDYPGAGNYDYNDHMFVIKNVKPHVLTSTNDANGDRINDALQRDTDGDGLVNFFDTTNTAQTPFGGTAPQIGAAPVVIDATRFDLGGQGVAYNDTTANDEGGTAGRNEGVDIVGNNVAVGYIAAGEWIEYTVNVARAGVHTLTFAAASPDPGRTITASFEQNGSTYVTAASANVVDTNNYTSFTATAPVQVNLAAGVQTVRLTFGGGAFDLDTFTIDRANVAPTVAQTLSGASATQGQFFSYTIPAGTFVDVDGDALAYTVTGLPAGLSFNAATRVISGTPLTAGSLTLQVTASDGAASVSTPLAVAVAALPGGLQQPFGGTAPTFTNGVLTVDASNFDTGGQGIAYNDNAGRDGGTTFRSGEAVEFVNSQNDIGYIRPGEWVEYTINAPTGGTYDLSFLAKTPLANASIAVSLNGGAALGTAALQDGGASFDAAPFQASAPIGVNLAAGVQTLRLTFNGTPQAGSPYVLDLRSFTLDLRETPLTQTPFGGTAAGFSNGVLTVDASNYDNGGQGVAYNDAAGLQGGTNGGRAGSAVEQTGAGDIGWIDAGDWTEYTISVPTAGAYDLDLLLSNGGETGRSAKVDFYKPGVATPYATSGSIANPSTGSYNTFVAREVDDIALDAGTQIVRVTFSGGSQDFRSFTLTAPSNPQNPFNGTAPTFTNGVLTVDASNFDTGGQGIAYNDNAGRDGGTTFRAGEAVEFVNSQNDIGYIRPGEWVEYTINAPTGGTYDLSFLAKTPLANASIAVSLNGGAALGTAALQDGGTSFGAAPFQASEPIGITLAEGVQTLRLTFNGTPQAGSPYVLDLRSFTLDLREPGPNALSALTANSETGLGEPASDSTAFSMQSGGVEKFVWFPDGAIPNDVYATMTSAMSELYGSESVSQAVGGGAADPHLPLAGEPGLGSTMVTDAPSGITVPKALFSTPTPTHFNFGVRFAMPATPDPVSHQSLHLDQETSDQALAPLSPVLGEFETLMHIA
ncbi:MAG TPA: carbohydrate-binding protein [Methylobacterium sp.]|jgi:hypothetical protein|uniref:carbohydrate-binding protein n=1 Tax=Methylorubrum sp. B1-46 TaxID=2897334 RepID=UPI001E56E9A9|nr:carbohydrate-binding protein [Methylorubrum sp. B1-46]UGB27287.1 carbohydrate-binding protein [Methylorubrum sp. B1-46]HEV2545696.1 carbohydrate-binding protein [Methylobacterium sp.]